MTEIATEVKKVRIEVPGPEGSNPEVFEGATEAEVLQKIADAKAHATRKIHEQQQQLAEREAAMAELEARLTPAEPAPTTDGFDRNAYFNTLYEDPLKAFDIAFERRFGMTPEQATSQWGSLTAAAQQLDIINIGQQWKRKHPELDTTYADANGQVLGQILDENGLPYNEKSLELAYKVALQEGKLKLVQSNSESAPPSPPATLTNTGNSGDTVVDDATATSGMTLDQKREYYRSKIQRTLQQRQ